MPPPEPTAGTTRSADKEGDGVALVHSLRGGRPGWGEEPSRQGEPSLAVVVEAAHGSLISAGDRPSAAVRSVCSSPSFSPSPPLATGGPDLGRKWCPGQLPVTDLRPGWSLGHEGSSGVPSAGCALACGCSGPSLGIGSGVSPGVGRVRQGPPHGGAVGP
jgi:hypothetical protein